VPPPVAPRSAASWQTRRPSNGGSGVGGIIAAFVILFLGVGGGFGFYFHRILNKPARNAAPAGETSDARTEPSATATDAATAVPAGQGRGVVASAGGATGGVPADVAALGWPAAPADNMVRKIIANPGLSERDIAEYANFKQERVADICVIYVNRMRFDSSGYGGPQGLLNRANGVVADANKRFREKGVMGKLRLVGVVEVDYADTNKSTDLNRAHALQSGVDSVSAIRNRLGADLVCLFVLKSSGGVAHTPGTYSVVGKGKWPTSFTHEIQHNFGWKHGHGENLWTVKENFPMNAKRLPQRLPYGKVFIQYRNRKDCSAGLL